jgi:hypothetical protein
MMLPMRVEARPLAEAGRSFKRLGSVGWWDLTRENKEGTLCPSPGAIRPAPEQIKSTPVQRSQEGSNAMIAPLGTLAFLATLWLLVVLGASVLEESGAKIAAALKVKPAHQPRPVRLRMRMRSRQPAPMRARPRLRAVA